jgi:hypothetical protein
LPFIVIGGIAYAPYLLFKHMFGRKQPPTIPEARRVIPMPPKFQPAAAALVAERPKPERRKRGAALRVVGEVFSGALVGGLLGAVTVVGPVGDWQMNTLLNCVALGAGIGGVVGFVVGGPRPTATEKTPTTNVMV